MLYAKSVMTSMETVVMSTMDWIANFSVSAKVRNSRRRWRSPKRKSRKRSPKNFEGQGHSSRISGIVECHSCQRLGIIRKGRSLQKNWPRALGNYPGFSLWRQPPAFLSSSDKEFGWVCSLWSLQKRVKECISVCLFFLSWGVWRARKGSTLTIKPKWMCLGAIYMDVGFMEMDIITPLDDHLKHRCRKTRILSEKATKIKMQLSKMLFFPVL